MQGDLQLSISEEISGFFQVPAGCHLVAGSGEGPAPLKEFLQPSSLPTLTSQPQRPRLEPLQGLPCERDAFVQIFVHFAVCFLPMFRPHQPLLQNKRRRML